MTSATTAAEAAARSALLDVRSYQVHLDLTAGPESVRSRTEIEFGCRQPGATTFADLDPVAVTSAALNDMAIDSQTAAAAGRLQLTDLAADNTLVVEAIVAAAPDGRGLAWSTDPADGGQYAFVSCYPTYASRVFCCFDQLDLRADLTLTVTAPAGWECAGNGAVAERPAPGEAGVWRFTAARAIKPYDVTFCAGPYVAAPGDGLGRDGPDSVPVTVRTRASLAGAPGLAKVARITELSLRYYEQLLGVSCPYDKLDIVFVSEARFAGMQVPGLMCMSEPWLQWAAGPDDDHAAVVVAHEVAHLWFGGLTDCSWWDDLWLAEALANYVGYRAAEAVLGQQDAWAEFGLAGQEGAYRADSLPNTQPVSSPIERASDALTRPVPITYAKGTAVLRQLAAQIGDEAMRAGLRAYLTRYAWSASTLADLISCWSAASGRDLTGWARQWLQSAGVNTLRPEIAAGNSNEAATVTIIQEPPVYGGPGSGPLRQHVLTIGAYERDGNRLRRTSRVTARIDGPATTLPALAGRARPAALILNDADLTFAKIRFDAASHEALTAAAMDVGDPLAESVCWNAFWDMVQTAELGAADFAGLVARRISGGGPAAGATQLLDRAISTAGLFAGPGQRTAILAQLAAAALGAARASEPGSRRQRVLTAAFASSADSEDQLELIRGWIDGDLRQLPGGALVDLELRARALATLAAHDRVSDADLAAYAAADPVGGAVVTATCSARRPALAAKEAAWQAAITTDRFRLALAHATGFWVPGQEELTAGYLDPYFSRALPAFTRHDARSAQRLARALYPVTLADDGTLAATDADIARRDGSDPLRAVLIEQRAVLRQVITARSAAARLIAGPAGQHRPAAGQTLPSA